MESFLPMVLHTLVSTAETNGNWSVCINSCKAHDSIRALLALIFRTDVSVELEDLLGQITQDISNSRCIALPMT